MQVIPKIVQSRHTIRDILSRHSRQVERQPTEIEERQPYAGKTFTVQMSVTEAIKVASEILDTDENRFVRMGNRQIICLSRIAGTEESLELIVSFAIRSTDTTEIKIESSRPAPKRFIAHSYKIIDTLHGLIRRVERKLCSLESPFSWLISIADNPEIDPSVLEEVSNHPDMRVKSAVADNPKSPLPVLWKLASDSNPDIRLQLAENHNAAPQLLQKLADDTDFRVAQRARCTLTDLLVSIPEYRSEPTDTMNTPNQ